MTTSAACTYPIPENETERLAVLRSLQILDTPPEPSFDRIAILASRLMKAPIAFISLVDEDRQWFKARYGSTATDTPRALSFCAHSMLETAPTVVCDATLDIRFRDNPLVTGEMGIRFYVGAPIKTRQGVPLGSLCVIDTVVRDHPPQYLLDSLMELAHLVTDQPELHSALTAKTRAEDAQSQAEERYRLFAETARDLFLIVDEKRRIVSANHAAKSLLGYEPASLIGREFASLVPACPISTGSATLELRALHKSGDEVPVEISFSHFQGRERMFTAILRDITDRKKTELALAQSARELRRSLAEKETLLQEVHHRVKNNLQIVSSLLRLQADSVTDRSAVAALKESQQRVLSMAMIHERFYAGKQMTEIEFDDYARTLVHELVYSHAGRAGNVSGRILPPPIRLGIGQAIPCGLILNELVTNALKHAYPDCREGEVVVELHETPEGRIQLSVTDQGRGLPPGFNFENTNSLGLRIVDVLTKQLAGTFTVDTSRGTSFRLEFQRDNRRAEK